MISKKTVDYSKITEYDREKRTKRENYRILNEEYALKNQTVFLFLSFKSSLDSFRCLSDVYFANFSPSLWPVF